ncbi:MAG: hypothetical protein N4A46_17080 [Schleiferiaceae bacterium]|jgi:predicted peptidase|nr:hypothetical protein [Schleiferiaceae bacterium]
MKYLVAFFVLTSFWGCQAQTENKLSPPELKRVSYVSQLDQKERDYFLYLPEGYHSYPDSIWPVVMHLHGNGERGNGKSDLKWTLKHGPLMEAWIQKKNFPFILIVPQLHMMGMDTIKAYIAKRDTNTIPMRLENGSPERIPVDTNFRYTKGPKTTPLPYPKEGNIRGWYKVQEDLITIVNDVQKKHRGSINQTYLTGLSYGGFGTWYMASTYPNKFAAILPVCGWGHPELMESIKKQELPIWCFAGERDMIIQTQHFYPGFKRLKDLGHNNYSFTIVPKVGHDVWKVVYQNPEIYTWLLNQKLDD